MKNTKKIVVIEGDDSLRVLLDRMLGKYFSVECFKHGFEALAWLADGNETQLILADLSMSDISGMNFLENVKTSGMFQNIPVIVLSDNNPFKESRCLELGALSYITKPFKPEALVDFIVHSMNTEIQMNTVIQKSNDYVQFNRNA